jgi:hypothetical protein
MSTRLEELVLNYHELHLVRRAVIRMAYGTDLNKEDAEALKKLEHQLADATEVVLRDIPRY